MNTNRMKIGMRTGVMVLGLSLMGVTAMNTQASAQTAAQTPPGQIAPATTYQKLTPEEKIQKRMEHLQKKLNLTDQQAAQMRTVLEQNAARLRADRDAVHAATDANRKAARMQLRTDQKAMRGQLKGVLTPEQLKKFKEMREDRREHRGH
ncbi:MAG: hypothetical protein ABI444_02920 [Candidatus Kapaibacterium sp.]|jgi:Spy/CpxP family protein refolding chaperone